MQRPVVGRGVSAGLTAMLTLAGCGDGTATPNVASAPTTAPKAQPSAIEREGGTELVLAPIANVPWGAEQAQATAAILRKRLASGGIRGAEVVTDAGGNVVVQVSGTGAERLERVKRLTLSAGMLELRLVARESEVGRWRPPNAPDGHRWVQPRDPDDPPELVRMDAKDTITSHDIGSAEIIKGPLGRFALSVNIKPGASERFARITGDNIDRKLAIIWDNRVVLAPTLREKISGKALISPGEGFSRTEADEMAAIIAHGPLPAPLGLTEQRRVGPKSKR